MSSEFLWNDWYWNNSWQSKNLKWPLISWIIYTEIHLILIKLSKIEIPEAIFKKQICWTNPHFIKSSRYRDPSGRHNTQITLKLKTILFLQQFLLTLINWYRSNMFNSKHDVMKWLINPSYKLQLSVTTNQSRTTDQLILPYACLYAIYLNNVHTCGHSVLPLTGKKNKSTTS